MAIPKAVNKETPRTNALVFKLQSQPIPFELCFWQLLDLTRALERENRRLKQKRQEEKTKPPLRAARKR